VTPQGLILFPDSFRSLSNELGNLKIALCPAVRSTVTQFAQFRATNATYFLSARSAYDQPGSILAGDNNLSVHPSARSVAGAGSPPLELGWTKERHGGRGNLLFADGHVEGRVTLGIPVTPARSTPPTRLTKVIVRLGALTTVCMARSRRASTSRSAAPNQSASGAPWLKVRSTMVNI